MRELIPQRAVVAVLVRRALIARYRGTALGFLWTFLQPLLTFAVYALVFGVYVRVEVPGGNYPAFLLAGLLPWTWFASGTALATTSILADAPWVRQAAFSPAVPPSVTAISSLVNFLFGLPLLMGVLWALGVPPTPWLLLLPIPIAAQLIFLWGISLLLAPLTVRFRDVAQLVQTLLPLWFFLTPVVYAPEAIPAAFRPLLLLNPMAPLVDTYQALLLRGAAPSLAGLGLPFVWGALAVAVGALTLGALRDRLPEEL